MDEEAEKMNTAIMRVLNESPEIDLDVLTDKIFDELNVPTRWRRTFRPALRHWLGVRHRQFVHKKLPPPSRVAARETERILVEVRKRRGLPAKGVAEEPADPEPPLTRRPSFLHQTCQTFGPRGRVTHGEMTPEEHRIRADYLHKQAATVVQGAEQHREWADKIEAAGVTCLNDLPEYKGMV